MSKFDYDDVVRALHGPNVRQRVGEIAWVVGVVETRPSGSYFEKFAPGTVYTIEFEDGSSIEVHETEIELLQRGE